MANPQSLKELEKIPFRLRVLRGFCEDLRPYELYVTQYHELFQEVWAAVENDELTVKEGREILEECQNISAWT